jgi:nucleotide-binding universal stress UspA family protein
MRGVRKVLIAVNGSKEVLRQGLQLAGDERCWVTVVKVVPENEGDLDLTGVKDIGDVLASGAGREVAEIGGIADAARALVKTRVETGAVHERILEVAEEERCDVIILGQRKRSWLRKLFGDNVVGKVIRRAHCPVLVVGATG